MGRPELVMADNRLGAVSGDEALERLVAFRQQGVEHSARKRFFELAPPRPAVASALVRDGREVDDECLPVRPAKAVADVVSGALGTAPVRCSRHGPGDLRRPAPNLSAGKPFGEVAGLPPFTQGQVGGLQVHDGVKARPRDQVRALVLIIHMRSGVLNSVVVISDPLRIAVGTQEQAKTEPRARAEGILGIIVPTSLLGKSPPWDVSTPHRRSGGLGKGRCWASPLPGRLESG